MRDISVLVDRLGGMAQKRQLVALGATDRDLTVAVRLRSVLRVRNGWYTTRGTTEPAVRAVRVGGRLTGLAAIADAGGWVRGTPRLSVAVRRNAARLRSPWNRRRPRSGRDGVRLYWDSDPSTGSATRVAVVDALRRVLLDEPLEVAVAAVDWAFHAGELDVIAWEALVLSLPKPLRSVAGWVDPQCGSLPESLSRTRLRRRGLRVRSQVPVPGSAIDLVVEDAVAVEVDGERFHRDRFERDRAKDLEISLLGLHAMRPSARTVFERWADLEQAVLLALAARGLGPSSPPPRVPARRRHPSRSRKLRRSRANWADTPSVRARDGTKS